MFEGIYHNLELRNMARRMCFVEGGLTPPSLHHSFLVISMSYLFLSDNILCQSFVRQCIRTQTDKNIKEEDKKWKRVNFLGR